MEYLNLNLSDNQFDQFELTLAVQLSLQPFMTSSPQENVGQTLICVPDSIHLSFCC